MPLTEKKKASNKAYDKKNYQYWPLKIRIGEKEKIQEAASAVGESLNGYILHAIADRMQRDAADPNARQPAAAVERGGREPGAVE